MILLSILGIFCARDVGWIGRLESWRAGNIVDITIVATAYQLKPGDPKWNELADLDKNGIVNIVDTTMVAKDYGKTVQSVICHNPCECCI